MGYQFMQMADVAVVLRVFLAVVCAPAAVLGFELIKSSVTASDGTASKWAQAAYAFLYVPFVATIVFPGPGMFLTLPPEGRLILQAAHSVAATLPLIIAGFLACSFGLWKFQKGFMMGPSGEPKALQLAVLGAAMVIAGVVHSVLVWVPATW